MRLALWIFEYYIAAPYLSTHGLDFRSLVSVLDLGLNVMESSQNTDQAGSHVP